MNGRRDYKGPEIASVRSQDHVSVRSEEYQGGVDRVVSASSAEQDACSTPEAVVEGSHVGGGQ